MKTDKKNTRLRRARKLRAGASGLAVHRLCVHRTPRHVYAQIIAPDGASTLASASTLEKDATEARNKPGKIEAAQKVGEMIAKRALEKGVERVGFDRSGFRYHGRVKALAEAARAGGLKF